MTRHIDRWYDVTITLPDGAEEVLRSSERARFAVVYRGNYGRWCVYGAHASRLNAETNLADYQEEVGETWPDSHPMVTDQVRATALPSAHNTTPFQNGVIR